MFFCGRGFLFGSLVHTQRSPATLKLCGGEKRTHREKWRVPSAPAPAVCTSSAHVPLWVGSFDDNSSAVRLPSWHWVVQRSTFTAEPLTDYTFISEGEEVEGWGRGERSKEKSKKEKKNEKFLLWINFPRRKIDAPLSSSPLDIFSSGKRGEEDSEGHLSMALAVLLSQVTALFPNPHIPTNKIKAFSSPEPSTPDGSSLTLVTQAPRSLFKRILFGHTWEKPGRCQFLPVIPFLVPSRRPHGQHPAGTAGVTGLTPWAPLSWWAFHDKSPWKHSLGGSGSEPSLLPRRVTLQSTGADTESRSWLPFHAIQPPIVPHPHTPASWSVPISGHSEWGHQLKQETKSCLS